jgi:D-alanine-D-alanine ligase
VGKRIAVIFGGTSSERDVSVASAKQVVTALRRLGHSVVAVDTLTGPLSRADEAETLNRGVAPVAPPTLSGLGRLAQNPEEFFAHPVLQDLDLIFIALHGGTGEDGHLQALLDLNGFAYTGSGVIGSAVAMDKDIAKRLMRDRGVPTPDWLMAPQSTEVVEQALGFPVIVKASKQGSTVGLSIVRRPEELAEAMAQAFLHDDEVLIERFVPGRELTVGVLNGQALSVGEIILSKGEIFDYEAKYQPGGATEVFPADLPLEKTEEVRHLGVAVAEALKLRDYCRIDFRMDREGRLWCLEANTLPGLTAMSLLPQSAAVVGISFDMLCQTLVDLALERHRAL